MGVNADISGRNDLLVGNRKFSGNAQFSTSKRMFSHGTLLFDSNLDEITRALDVKMSKIESKGHKSVRSRVANISEFINVISDYEENINENNLSEFLNSLSISSSVDGLDSSSESITLMTIHLAKGLEFPCVFFVGIEDQIVPHSRTHDNENEIEEERRLCYVAITRAIKKLHLSYANFRKVFGQIIPSGKSRFVEEIANSENILRLDGISTNSGNSSNEEKKVFF